MAHNLMSNRWVNDFTWGIHGTTFTNSSRLLQSDGYDLILGCDWMDTHSPISLIFEERWLP